MNSIDLEVSCSKGTYIRTLCVDIGKKLGYFAHMSDLKRIESDSFKASETFTFSDIESIINSNEANKMINPPSRALNHLETYSVDENMKRLILFDHKLPLPETKYLIISILYYMMFNDHL